MQCSRLLCRFCPYSHASCTARATVGAQHTPHHAHTCLLDTPLSGGFACLEISMVHSSAGHARLQPTLTVLTHVCRGGTPPGALRALRSACSTPAAAWTCSSESTWSMKGHMGWCSGGDTIVRSPVHGLRPARSGLQGHAPSHRPGLFARSERHF